MGPHIKQSNNQDNQTKNKKKKCLFFLTNFILSYTYLWRYLLLFLFFVSKFRSHLCLWYFEDALKRSQPNNNIIKRASEKKNKFRKIIKKKINMMKKFHEILV